MEQPHTLTVMDYLPAIALAVSIVSAVLAIVSYRRTAQLQDIQIAPRLQVADESVYVNSPGAAAAFSYEACLENCGQYSLQIVSVAIDYGLKDEPERRLKHIIEPAFYLGVNEKRKVSYTLSKSNFTNALDKFEAVQLNFYLRVRFESQKGTQIEAIRPLVSLGESTIFQANATDILA